MTYDNWFQSTFGVHVPTPGTTISTSWSPESKFGHRAHCALIEIEVDYVKEMIGEIRDRNIPGDFAEFGIFEGWWVSKLWELTEEVSLFRNIYGFDSFEGLSDPDPKYDSTFWKRGMYACSLDQVRANVQAAKRRRIQLIKGFFEESLKRPQAQQIQRFCFARIDCDMYMPALQCLQYLGPRLSDGAILIFDDWPHALDVGEQKALMEWLPEVAHLKLEFLFYNTFGHFYLKVHHVADPPPPFGER